MALDLQEQEQLAQFKGWWEDTGKYLAAAVAAALVAFGGWQGYKSYERHQSAEAADLYGKLETLTGDAKGARAAADEIKNRFASTAYAPRAALIAAKASADVGELGEAEAQLNWVVANADEAALRDVARLRLAAVQIDRDNADVALKTLGAAETDAYAGLFAEQKGDVQMIKGDKAAAVASYKVALEKLPKESANLQFVQVKLDAIDQN
ncbi:YfgM family protein [Chitinibacteraceae bacterium HSL-7]